MTYNLRVSAFYTHADWLYSPSDLRRFLVVLLNRFRRSCPSNLPHFPVVSCFVQVWKGLSEMGKRLYVGNLPWSTSSSELQALFEPYGAVRAAEVIMDRVTGRSRGFGFVEMENDNTMNAAIEALNGKDLNGRPLVVNEARERSPRPPGGGGGGGGRGRYEDH